MPFPADWPPRVASGVRSYRFYATGTATALFEDNAFLFIEGAGANTTDPLPVVESGDDVSRFPQPSPTNLPPHPAGTGERSGDPPAMIWSNGIRIVNESGAPLEISFDGVNVHGIVLVGTEVVYGARHEAGIAVRGDTAVFHIEAW